jgi:hypothetical protein
MPIKPENRLKYPKDWTQISQRIRFGRAQGRCECLGECGRGHAERCGATNGQPHPETGSRVILTVAHLDHDHSADESRLRAFCQACHLAYDAAERIESSRDTRDTKRDERTGQLRIGDVF